VGFVVITSKANVRKIHLPHFDKRGFAPVKTFVHDHKNAQLFEEAFADLHH
jgi:hypothetical protein